MSRFTLQFMSVCSASSNTQNNPNVIIHRIITLYSGTSAWRLKKIIIKQVNRNVCASLNLENKRSIKKYRLLKL